MNESIAIHPQHAVHRQDQPRRPLSVGCAWAAALCLAIPALANTAFHALTPVTGDTAATAAAQAAAHPDLAQVAALQFTLPVLAVGVAVLAWRASAVTQRLAVLAGIFLAGGYLLGMLDSVSDLLQAIVPPLAGQGAGVQVSNGFGATIAGHFAAIAIIGQAPGLVLMGIALWRSRIVPRWLAAAFVATLPVQILAHSGDGNRPPAFSWAWYSIILTLCGAYLVRAARAERAALDPGGEAAPCPDVSRQETMAG